MCANSVNVTGLNDLKANFLVVDVVTGATEGGTNTSVDRLALLDQTLLGSVVKVGTVVDGSNFGLSTAKDLGLPGIQMRVKMNNRHRAICGVNGTQ